MQTATIAKKPRKQAISGRFWAGRTYRGRIKDDHKIDVWVGSGEKKIDAIMCIVDLRKKDSEIKILVGCTEEEKLEVYKTHNETQYMKGVLIRR